MVAFTYYAHRDKMRLIGKEDLIRPLQTDALNLAKQAAAEEKNPPHFSGGKHLQHQHLRPRRQIRPSRSAKNV